MKNRTQGAGIFSSLKVLAMKRTLGRIIFAVAMGLSSSVMANTVTFTGNGLLNVDLGTLGLWNAEFHNTWQGDSYDKPFVSTAIATLASLFIGTGALQGSNADYFPSSALGCDSSVTCEWGTVTTRSGPYWELGIFANYNSSYDHFDYSYFPNSLYTQAAIENFGHPDYYYNGEFTYVSWFEAQSSPVPLPAAIWLFGSALAGFGVLGRRKA